MIKFGPSGNSIRFYEEGNKTTVEAAKWVADNDLDCFEYSFGRGVNIGATTCEAIKNAFEAQNIEISVHAPYFINFANPDDEKANNSYNYVLSSALAARNMGAKRIVIHPASVGKETREVAFSRTLERFQNLAALIVDYGYENMIFCPETMGKMNQIGTIEEITEICQLADFYVPTVDFGHVNARENGSLKEKEDYLVRLQYMIDKLGFEKMRNFHVHFSKIEYTAKGEVRHLTFSDSIYGPEFDPLAEALCELKLEPYIICESDGTQADDAITMKKIFNRVKQKYNN